MKILRAIWFTEMGTLHGTIGIVIAEDKHGGKRAYIGTGDGEEQERDAQKILKWGAKFPLEAAEKL